MSEKEASREQCSEDYTSNSESTQPVWGTKSEACEPEFTQSRVTVEILKASRTYPSAILKEAIKGLEEPLKDGLLGPRSSRGGDE